MTLPDVAERVTCPNVSSSPLCIAVVLFGVALLGDDDDRREVALEAVLDVPDDAIHVERHFGHENEVGAAGDAVQGDPAGGGVP